MDESMKFVLSYEVLTQTAEVELKKCDLNQDNPSFPLEMEKASTILSFWHTLALRGHTGLDGYACIEKDWLRLRSILKPIVRNQYR